MTMNHYNVLYLEAGSSGQGGSFVSLLQLISVFSNKKNHLHIILWNDSPYIPQYQALGASVLKIDNPIYSMKKAVIRTLYNLATRVLRRIYPSLLIQLELWLQYFCYRKIVSYAKQNSINLIHLNNQPMRNFIGFWAAKKLNLPALCHLRTLNGYGMTRAHIKFLNTLRCHMIAVSESAAIYWQQCGIPNEWITRIANPYQGSLNQEKKSKKLGYSLVCISRLAPRKGLMFLLEAFHELVQIDSRFTLSIIGDGELRGTLLQKVSSLKLMDHVKLLGYVHEASQQLADYDVLVFVSEQEGFGRVILEGMSAGIPIVATNVAGVNEILQHRHNGLLIEYGEKQQFVQSVLSLYRDEAIRIKLLDNARQSIEMYFNMDLFYKKISTLYDAVLVG